MLPDCAAQHSDRVLLISRWQRRSFDPLCIYLVGLPPSVLKAGRKRNVPCHTPSTSCIPPSSPLTTDPTHLSGSPTLIVPACVVFACSNVFPPSLPISQRRPFASIATGRTWPTVPPRHGTTGSPPSSCTTPLHRPHAKRRRPPRSSLSTLAAPQPKCRFHFFPGRPPLPPSRGTCSWCRCRTRSAARSSTQCLD